MTSGASIMTTTRIGSGGLTTHFRVALWGLVLLVAAPAFAAERPAGRRWVLVIGQNAGDPDDERLRFADNDARNFLHVMLELGSVEPSNTIALYGATAPRVRRALAQLRQWLESEATAQDQLFVYVSSHADGGELHLDGSRFPLSELNAFVREAPVAVGVFILDGCRSGALTRLKGLKPVEGVSIQVDTGDITGRVIISSSGPDEYAQESDDLQGSFFTHHLVSALRGAADGNRDAQVTLQEAYAYAYSRTLDSTFGTRGGLQRPSYHMDLRGHGDLVLSELRLGKARLALDDERPGAWQIVSADGGTTVAQIEKGRGSTELVLSPGRYRVRTRVDDGQLEKTVSIPPGGRVSVRSSELTWTPLPRVAMKGGRLLVTLCLGGAGATSLIAGVQAPLGAEARGLISSGNAGSALPTPFPSPSLTGAVRVAGWFDSASTSSRRGPG